MAREAWLPRCAVEFYHEFRCFNLTVFPAVSLIGSDPVTSMSWLNSVNSYSKLSILLTPPAAPVLSLIRMMRSSEARREGLYHLGGF